MKTNITGQTEWNQTIGGLRADFCFSVVESSDGGYMLAGRTESYGAGGTDMLLVKTNAIGQIQWNHTFGGTEEEAAYSVIATSDEGYVIVGRTESYSTGEADTWFLKIIVQSVTTLTTRTTYSSTFKSSTSSHSRLIPGMSSLIVICVFLTMIMVKRRR